MAINHKHGQIFSLDLRHLDCLYCTFLFTLPANTPLRAYHFLGAFGALIEGWIRLRSLTNTDMVPQLKDSDRVLKSTMRQRQSSRTLVSLPKDRD